MKGTITTFLIEVFEKEQIFLKSICKKSVIALLCGLFAIEYGQVFSIEQLCMDNIDFIIGSFVPNTH